MGWIGAFILAFLTIAGLHFLVSILFTGTKVGAIVVADAVKQIKEERTESQPAAATQDEEDQNTA
jgi:hypothetical protein